MNAKAARFSILTSPALLLAAGGVCLAALYVNPQWSKYVWMFRVYRLGHWRHGFRPDGFSGAWRTWYKNGQLATEKHYEDGQSHGRDTRWYRNGNLEHVRHFKDGKSHGPTNYWHDNGVLAEDRTWRNGRKVGVHRVWDSRGRLLAEGVYRGDLRWEGTFAEGIDVSTNTTTVTSYVEGRDAYGRRHNGLLPLDPLPDLEPEEEEPCPLDGTQ